MTAKDGRRNADQPQTWIETRYLDSTSYKKRLAEITAKMNFIVYGFCGMSPIGHLRIDFNPNSNANLVMDFFEFLDSAKSNFCDCLILDPLFELYNPNPKVWEKLIRTGKMPESVRKSKYFGKNHAWQKRAFELVKPGGVLITKRNIANTNVLTKIPTMWYVGDNRSSAFIVRLDWKR